MIIKPKLKECPIDGHEIGIDEARCYDYDCSNCSEDNYYMLHGKKCHCIVERDRIKASYKEKQDRKRKNNEMRESRQIASKISIEEFYDYCHELEKKLKSLRQKYGPDMIIKPYKEDNQKWIVVIYSGDNIIEVASSDHIVAYVSSKFDKLLSEEMDYSISMCTVPEELSDAIVTKMKLDRRMDVSRNVQYDNPVYLKRKDVAKYVKAAYGFEWWDYEKIAKQHLEITEIVNYGIVIYLKPEIDQMIRYEAMRRNKNEG